jgi:hypothetical protein
MSEEFMKAFTERQLHWLSCAMHEPLVLPPVFDLACCTISPPERQERLSGSRCRAGPPPEDRRAFSIAHAQFLAQGL